MGTAYFLNTSGRVRPELSDFYNKTSRTAPYLIGGCPVLKGEMAGQPAQLSSRGLGNLNRWLAIVLLFLLVFTSFCPPAFSEVSEKEEGNGVETDDKITVLDFKEEKLCNILKVLSELTGKNVIANKNINDLPITIFIKNVSPMDALKILCKQNNLWYRESHGYLRLMKVEDYGKDILLHYEEKVRIINLKYVSCVSVADAIDNVMGGRVDYEEPDEEKSYSHIGAGDEDISEPGGGISGGGGGGAGGGRAVVLPEITVRKGEEKEKGISPEKIEQFLEKAEKKELEAEEILKIRKEKGIANMTIFLPNNSILLYSTDKELLDEIGSLIRQLDLPVRQVLLEGKIFELTLSDDFSSFFDWGYKSGSGRYGVKTGFKPMEAPSLIYNFTNLKEFRLRMELLEEKAKIKTIATPMALSANNAQAKFFVGEERPVVTGYRAVTGVVTWGTATETAIEPVTRLEKIGTKLWIIPLVNEDRMLTLKTRLEISTFDFRGGEINLLDPVTGGLVAMPVDIVKTTEVENILTVQDKELIVIGGLVREADRLQESKVPFLGDIPGLGFFFKRHSTKKERLETIMAIIPHIMMSVAEADEVSEGASKDFSEHPSLKEGKKKLLDFEEMRR
jgi:general secretion pathway protein D